MAYYYYYYYYLLTFLLTYLLTYLLIYVLQLSFSLGGSSPYTSTDKTYKNIRKQTNTKTQYKQYKNTVNTSTHITKTPILVVDKTLLSRDKRVSVKLHGTQS